MSALYRRHGAERMAGLALVFVGFLFGFDSGVRQQTAQGALTRSSALFSGNVAVAIDHHVNRINIGLIHSREIGIFGKHNAAGARMLLQIFLHRFLGFGNVDRENDQALPGKLSVDFLDQWFLLMAVLAPCCPKFKQNNLAFDRFIVEAFARGSFRTEAWSGCSVLIGGEDAGCEKQAEAGHAVYAKAHGGGMIAQRSWRSANFLCTKTPSGIAAQTERIGAPAPSCSPFSSGFGGNFCRYP